MSSKIPQLNSCCCGCTLEQGSRILGWFHTIVGAIGIIAFISALVTGSSAPTPSNVPPMSTADLTVQLVVVIITTIVSIFLLIGISRRRPSYVFPWVIIMAILVTISIITMIVTAITRSALELITIPFLLLDIYFILVVYSYYRELQRSPGTGTV